MSEPLDSSGLQSRRKQILLQELQLLIHSIFYNGEVHERDILLVLEFVQFAAVVFLQSSEDLYS